MSTMAKGYSVIVTTYYAALHIQSVQCKGGAVAGAAAGGGASAGVDWTAGGNYTTKEMTVALIVLAIVMTISFIICSCQCYQKLVWELEGDHWFFKDGKRPMPPAPYNRDSSVP